MGSQLIKLMEEGINGGGNGGGKRNSTSLTYRIRTKEREGLRVVGVDDLQQVKSKTNTNSKC